MITGRTIPRIYVRFELKSVHVRTNRPVAASDEIKFRLHSPRLTSVLSFRHSRSSRNRKNQAGSGPSPYENHWIYTHTLVVYIIHEGYKAPALSIFRGVEKFLPIRREHYFFVFSKKKTYFYFSPPVISAVFFVDSGTTRPGTN